MKFVKPNKVLNAAGKFGAVRAGASAGEQNSSDLNQPSDLNQLGKHVITAFNDENLKVSEVRPFFWSMVEAYIDRFHHYPFDANKAVISYLELKNYPEDAVRELVKQLEAQFEVIHGRPLRKTSPLDESTEVLDDEIKQLRDSLKYAALVAEGDDTE